MAKIDGRRQFRLENKLTPWSSYSFRVAAYNDLGLGEWSEASPSYNTRPGYPLKSVTNIRLVLTMGHNLSYLYHKCLTLKVRGVIFAQSYTSE